MEPEHKGHPEEEILFGETIIFRFFVLFRNPAVNHKKNPSKSPMTKHPKAPKKHPKKTNPLGMYWHLKKTYESHVKRPIKTSVILIPLSTKLKHLAATATTKVCSLRASSGGAGDCWFLGGSREVVFLKNVSTIQICVYIIYLYIFNLYIFIKMHQNISTSIKVIPVIRIHLISTNDTNSNPIRLILLWNFSVLTKI